MKKQSEFSEAIRHIFKLAYSSPYKKHYVSINQKRKYINQHLSNMERIENKFLEEKVPKEPTLSYLSAEEKYYLDYLREAEACCFQIVSIIDILAHIIQKRINLVPSDKNVTFALTYQYAKHVRNVNEKFGIRNIGLFKEIENFYNSGFRSFKDNYRHYISHHGSFVKMSERVPGCPYCFKIPKAIDKNKLKYSKEYRYITPYLIKVTRRADEFMKKVTDYIMLE